MNRNPPWTRDEHILALDFYVRHTPTIPGKSSQEVRALSELLNRLQQGQTNNRTETFRNPSGVYMKLMNFRRNDPQYPGVGLSNGNKDEEVVWNLYASKPAELRVLAEEISKLVDNHGVLREIPDLDIEAVEAEEGRLLSRLHLYRERDRTIVAKKKKKFLQERGTLHCEACGFDFERVYGDRGRDFIECHHARPISELFEESITKLSDLILLCSNCHRMIHTQRPWISLQELRRLIHGDNMVVNEV